MWIVTYWIIQTFFIPCHPPTPVADEFGRTPIVEYQTSINCLRTDTTFKYVMFKVKDSAIAFIARGRADSAGTLGADSLYLGDYDKGGQLAGFTLLHPYSYDTMTLRPRGPGRKVFQKRK